MAHDNVHGSVSRLYTNRAGCNIRLDAHTDKYFQLQLDHPNYNGIYSLLVVAAVNRYRVRLRLENYEKSTPPSTLVRYLVVDWPQ